MSLDPVKVEIVNVAMTLRRFSAILLVTAIFLVAVALSTSIGGSLLPAAIAGMHGGWREIISLPVSDHIVLDPPLWLHETETLYGVVKIASIVLVLGLYLISFLTAARLARYLIVKKFRWMSDAELKKMSEKDPGF
jgi:hypothetical protein